MAGNKVSKAKGKYDKSKGTSIVPGNEETEDHDFSLLRKPIQTSITGLGQAKKIFDLATEELKKLLSDECDLLYECKVCRNLFRSLANFISHKRVYCKDTFNSNVHGHFVEPTPTHIEIKKIQETEVGYQESLKRSIKTGNDMELDEDDNDRIPMTKDLTTIVEKMARSKSSIYANSKDFQFALQEIPNTSVAVFQNIENEHETESENMLNQVSELDKILSKDMGVMQRDGNFKIQSSADVDNVIQISDDEDSADTNLKCKICDMQFSTQKTLKFHMKYKHVESRLVYPCPDCLEIFSTSWSVYRHLFKVHRKTAAQIRRLRESIQSKAFKMNNPPAFYERRKNQKPPAAPKITEEERIEQENQAWMDNVEFDGEVPRCGGCGRSFERRAALAAHTNTCQPRSRALARRPETKRIEIQIRKDYNKGPSAHVGFNKPTDIIDNKIKDEPIEEPATNKDNDEPMDQSVSTTEKDDKEPEQTPESATVDDKSIDTNENSMESVSRQSGDESNASESPEKVEIAEATEATPTQPIVRLPFAQHAEKSNLMALRQRIFNDIEIDKLVCKRCNLQSNHIRELYDHVASHYKWMRYACKLCNFKHYNFEELPDHVKTVHKLKGDKDFYYSTVKALDGAEALALSEDPVDDIESNEASPDSRRPSRASSDSSRLSDDSSSSSTRIEGSRKRKVQVNSRYAKRKRESLVKPKSKEEENDKDENHSSSNHKHFEENSSDIDDVYEKVEKRPAATTLSSVATRRPVRRKAKPKNEDFEYDLSNLLKLEAQGYRENQTGTSNTKTSQTKKKAQSDKPDNVTTYEMLNKECCGALDTLSRKAVENSRAEMKTSSFPVYSVSQNERPSSVFARPMLPKSLSKGDKISPKKESEENKEISSPSKDTKNKPQTEESLLKASKLRSEQSVSKAPEKDNANSNMLNTDATTCKDEGETKDINEDQSQQKTVQENICSKRQTITSVVPFKFRRQSIDVMKNPLINKNINEFSKAGMRTKILVIKPIKVKDGAQSVSKPLKFQTIKLKDPSRKSSGEDKSDQVVVVKVPNVERNVVLPVPESILAPTETINDSNESLLESNDQTPKNLKTVEATNGDGDNENTRSINNEIIEQKLDDKSEKSSSFRLVCDENILNELPDLPVSFIKNKPNILRIDKTNSSSNGLS